MKQAKTKLIVKGKFSFFSDELKICQKINEFNIYISEACLHNKLWPWEANAE